MFLSFRVVLSLEDKAPPGAVTFSPRIRVTREQPARRRRPASPVGILRLPAQQVAGLALEYLAERGERREPHRLGAVSAVAEWLTECV
jgi:hypothetical protein